MSVYSDSALSQLLTLLCSEEPTTKYAILPTILTLLGEPIESFSSELFLQIQEVMSLDDIDFSIPIVDQYLESLLPSITLRHDVPVEEMIVRGLSSEKSKIRLFAVKNLFHPFYLAHEGVFLLEKDPIVFAAMMERLSKCELCNIEFLANLRKMMGAAAPEINKAIIEIGLYNMSFRHGQLAIAAIDDLWMLAIGGCPPLNELAAKTLGKVAKEQHEAHELAA